MTEKETGELRRRYRPDRTNITAVRGCYVSASREILSTFRQSVGLMTEEDKEKYLGLLKKVLTGGMDKNLIDIRFTTKQVADSDEHRLLMALRDTRLEDETVLQKFYETVIASLALEENYLILLAHESYDVPFRGRDGLRLDDASNSSFSYILCAICPVKQAKSTLSYCAEEKEFHNRAPGFSAMAPELGFLFPAFDDRKTNLYDALYYTHSAVDNHAELIDALFKVEPPKPAELQKQSFRSLLGDALDDDCSLEVVQTVHEQLSQMIETHKEAKCDDPLVVSPAEVRAVLAGCGVSEQHLASFNVKYEQEFGVDSEISPRNLVDSKRFEVKTPDVVITVNPTRSDLIETRVLGGVKYILVCADEGVEVNGVNIKIPD